METLLTIQLITGDENAYNTIFNRYYKDLCVFASHYSGTTECEEIVQEVMGWLWENRSDLPPNLALRPFLFSAVKNKCINQINHKRIKSQAKENILKQYQYFFTESTGYEHYERKELINLLKKALNELPQEYREAFEMNRFHNMTYLEIAQRKCVSPKTVAYRISQTLKRLRIIFEDYHLL